MYRKRGVEENCRDGKMGAGRTWAGLCSGYSPPPVFLKVRDSNGDQSECFDRDLDVLMVMGLGGGLN